MTLEESKTDDDILDEEYGVSLITDKKLTALEGATVDFIESASGGGFEIRTAQSGASGGGCGDSCGGSC